MTSAERDLICRMAAEHCMSIAWLTETEKEGKPTATIEAEARRAYERLVAALHRAGYLAPYMVASGNTLPPGNLKH